MYHPWITIRLFHLSAHHISNKCLSNLEYSTQTYVIFLFMMNLIESKVKFLYMEFTKLFLDTATWMLFLVQYQQLHSRPLHTLNSWSLRCHMECQTLINWKNVISSKLQITTQVNELFVTIMMEKGQILF